MSPAQAAQLAKVSRSTVSRALKAGELRGFRDNRGHWRIEPDDLEQWSNSVQEQVPAHNEQPKIDHYTALALATARADIAEHRIEAAEQRAEAAERDRDEWRSQAQQLARAMDQRRWRWPWQ